MHVIHQAPAECFAIPHGAADQFTHIEITMFAGRSLSAKRELYQAIVQRLRGLRSLANDDYAY